MIKTTSLYELGELFSALEYAAYKHRNQRRKGTAGIPYINHPIEVASLLINTLNKPDLSIIIAAILHDTLEDTDASPVEIANKFGEQVLKIVEEVTDNMNLGYKERKKLQVEKAGMLSYEARCIKIADKACNVHDILHTRIRWPKSRKVEYIRWAIEVIKVIENTNTELVNSFWEQIAIAEELLKTKFR